MSVGKIDRRRECAGYLLERSLVEHSADVVVVIVDENHSAAIDELPHVAAFGLRESKRKMAGEIDEWIFQNTFRRKRNDHADGSARYLRIAHNRVDEIRRKRRRAVPVA